MMTARRGPWRKVREMGWDGGCLQVNNASFNKVHIASILTNTGQLTDREAQSDRLGRGVIHVDPSLHFWV